MASCQSNSYYNAMNTNQQRFDGWQEENAIFLTETHDQILLIEDLSELAQKSATLRETYLLAEDIEKEMADLQLSYQVEATIHRIKLASALSESSDKVLNKLETISDDNFDQVFLQYLKSELNDLQQEVIAYKKEGHNDRIRELADKVNDLIDDLNETKKQLS
ncbi:MAG: hypothetical protein CMB80_19785 [Flammeovirgaceae bacterium]|nr:hypothetical protein [Flammeovirgaceae bacterium]|tara:strand:+ start:1612 stop:2100 length:489 start_codon:yes stop_codon:yes gene_type:complete